MRVVFSDAWIVASWGLSVMAATVQQSISLRIISSPDIYSLASEGMMSSRSHSYCGKTFATQRLHFRGIQIDSWAPFHTATITSLQVKRWQLIQYLMLKTSIGYTSYRVATDI